MFPYTTTRPLGYDPEPHRQAITELETVLFYEGATDVVQHPPMVASLLDAFLASVEKDPATFKRADLIDRLKGLRDHALAQPAGAYRLNMTRQSWMSFRVSFFEPAVWFRTTSSTVDRLQARTQGASNLAGPVPVSSEGEGQATGAPTKVPVPSPSAVALLAILTDYERAVERYATRASNLALQACEGGASDPGQLGSLVADTRQELARLIGDDPTVRQRLGSVVSAGESILRARNTMGCQGAVTPSQMYSRELSTFQQYARDTRRSIETNPQGS
jgi:hypothetical protein